MTRSVMLFPRIAVLLSFAKHPDKRGLPRFWIGFAIQFAKQHPELFRGIERDLSNVIFAAQQRGAITPFEARNPETWKTSAEFIHLRRGNKELLLGKTPAVKAVETQKPSRARLDEDEDDEVELDLTDMELHKVMKQFGIKSVEKAKEIIKSEQKRVRSGENIPKVRRG